MHNTILFVSQSLGSSNLSYAVSDIYHGLVCEVFSVIII